MQGIELSRRLYLDVVQPWLNGAFPELRHAAALIGYGSELLGFDDEMSRDHNWGPRIRLLVTQRDFATHARRLVAEFSAVAPASFLGEPIGWRNRPHPPAGGDGAVGVLEHGLEVHTLEATLNDILGLQLGETLTPIRWLGFAEQRLLAFTGGAVFHDDDGRLTELRERLAYFPDDVWLYKIACQWRRIAEQQAFVGRTGFVDDDLGSRIIASRLAHDVMRMGFLLDRRYAPYAKWFGKGFARLPSAAEVSPALDGAMRADHWTERQDHLATAYLTLARRQVSQGIGTRFEPAIGPYFDRPFTTINADAAIEATRAAITDEAVRALPVIGSIDQVSDLTPVLEDPLRSHAIMRAVLD